MHGTFFPGRGMGKFQLSSDRSARSRPRTRVAGVRILAAGLVWALTVSARPVDGQSPPPAVAPSAKSASSTAATAKAEPASPSGPERLRLVTGDGVQLSAWYYPAIPGRQADAVGQVTAGKQTTPAKPPVALVVHDLEGTHASVEPLSRALQQRGIAVVAPDLRGHGDSGNRLLASGASEKLEPRLLKKLDFDAMTRTSGGRLRDQAAVRGDLEAVRGWIKRQADEGVLDFERFFVVGSGLGAAVAMAWAVEDAKWPPIATGPQGRQIRGLALVSPTWTTRGFSIAPALGDDLIRRGLPILLIAGAEDRDTVKLFEQLKRQRPTEWYEKRGRNPPATGLKQQPADGKAGPPPTLYLLQLDSPLGGDRLASWIDAGGRGNDPAGLIAGFITTFGTAAAD